MFDDLYDLIGSKVLSPVNLYPTNANTPRYPIVHILLFLMNPLIIYYYIDTTIYYIHNEDKEHQSHEEVQDEGRSV